jgi:hypothetical protein
MITASVFDEVFNMKMLDSSLRLNLSGSLDMNRILKCIWFRTKNGFLKTAVATDYWSSLEIKSGHVGREMIEAKQI